MVAFVVSQLPASASGLDLATVMPPGVHDHLVDSASFAIGFELARRFRIDLPPVLQRTKCRHSIATNSVDTARVLARGQIHGTGPTCAICIWVFGPLLVLRGRQSKQSCLGDQNVGEFLEASLSKLLKAVVINLCSKKKLQVLGI